MIGTILLVADFCIKTTQKKVTSYFKAGDNSFLNSTPTVYISVEAINPLFTICKLESVGP